MRRICRLLQSVRLAKPFSVSTEFPQKHFELSRFMSSSPSTSLFDFRIPSTAQGMKDLDKDKFKSTVHFPVIVVRASDINKLRGCVSKFTVKNSGRKLKPIMNCEDKDRKYIFFDPNIVNNEAKREEILTNVRSVCGDESLHWEEKDYDMEFDDWDMHSIFKSVLPDSCEYSAFTQTGHLIHCNLRDNLVPFRHIIGQILLEKVRNCRTVVYKPESIDNKFRTFQVELLAGEPDYVVETVEDGIKYKMDFTKVFWNSRLSYEHGRVLKQLTSNSLVFDACAGIGPFAIPAAKKQNCRLVCANDLNPDSVHWMKENIRLNKLSEGSIRVFNEDAVAFIRGPVADIIKQHVSLPPSDLPHSAHIIMNLPALAVKFLSAFRGMLSVDSQESVDNKERSTSPPEDPVHSPFPLIVHCYMFVKAHEDVAEDWYSEKAKEMSRKELDWDDIYFKKIHKVRTVSNRKEMMCVECEIPWRMLYATRRTIQNEEEERLGSVDVVENSEEGPAEKKQKLN